MAFSFLQFKLAIVTFITFTLVIAFATGLTRCDTNLGSTYNTNLATTGITSFTNTSSTFVVSLLFSNSSVYNNTNLVITSITNFTNSSTTFVVSLLFSNRSACSNTNLATTGITIFTYSRTTCAVSLLFSNCSSWNTELYTTRITTINFVGWSTYMTASGFLVITYLDGFFLSVVLLL